MNKISVKDIATALNLSPSTVSRALNNKGRISEKTKQQIYDYIEQMDPQYSSSNNNFYVVGILVAKLSNEFFAKVVENLQSNLISENILLNVMYTNYDYNKEKEALIKFVDAKVDCIVALATRHSTISRKELNNIPLISIDYSDPIIDDTPDYRVISDQFVGGVLATEELINKGCKKIAYFTNIAIHKNDLKFKGYYDTLKRYNIPYDKNLYITSGTHSDNSIQDARMTVDYLLAKNIEFDGVFATSDRRALGVILSLYNHGIQCPEQVKIVGYDNSTLAESFNITSISQEPTIIAQNCFYAILKYLNINTNYQMTNPIPVFLSRGQTT